MRHVIYICIYIYIHIYIYIYCLLEFVRCDCIVGTDCTLPRPTHPPLAQINEWSFPNVNLLPHTKFKKGTHLFICAAAAAAAKDAAAAAEQSAALSAAQPVGGQPAGGQRAGAGADSRSGRQGHSPSPAAGGERNQAGTRGAGKRKAPEPDAADAQGAEGGKLRDGASQAGESAGARAHTRVRQKMIAKLPLGCGSGGRAGVRSGSGSSARSEGGGRRRGVAPGRGASKSLVRAAAAAQSARGAPGGKAVSAGGSGAATSGGDGRRVRGCGVSGAGDGAQVRSAAELRVLEYRKAGNSCMKNCQFEDAVKHYTQAILLSRCVAATWHIYLCI